MTDRSGVEQPSPGANSPLAGFEVITEGLNFKAPGRCQDLAAARAVEASRHFGEQNRLPPVAR
jgi:hypothetical protein